MSYEIDDRMMSVEKEMSEATAASKEREKKIRELGKAVATKGTKLSVSLSVCLSLCLSVCLSVCLFVSLSVCLFICGKKVVKKAVVNKCT